MHASSSAAAGAGAHVKARCRQFVAAAHRRRAVARPRLAPRAAAASTAGDPSSTAAAAAPAPADKFAFCCPICLSTPIVIPAPPAPYARVGCERCGRSFEPAPSGDYLDLTLASGAPPRAFERAIPAATELFRQPFISFVYERGWRQGFAAAGFPGPEKEYEIAMRYLQPCYGGTLIDASCGTGLFTRLFAGSRRFNGVVALDFSETMLRQAREYLGGDTSLSGPGATPVAAVRADIARLPFATGSVDAIHAGAAIHCWPDPQAAMAEVSRVLKPGGVFVASTFLTALAPLGAVVGDDAVRPLSRALNPFNGSGGNVRYWQEPELVDLVNAVGLTGYERVRERCFIMFAARKPGGGGSGGSS